MGRGSAIRLIGVLLMLLGGFMVMPALYGLSAGDPATGALFASVALCVATGAMGFWAQDAATRFWTSGSEWVRRPPPPLATSVVATPVSAALGAVTVGWIIVAVAGGLPFLLTGALPWEDAVFEGVSAFTTTGATALVSVQSLSPSLLLWRSLLQWLGGMGIVVLFLSVFPRLGVGGLALFRAEMPGPAPAKVLPRLSSSSKLLWFMYAGLTTAAFFALWAVGLSPFDALNHAMTTVSTGGFSTLDEGPAAFSRAAQLVLVLFMFLGGTNFALLYRLFRFGDAGALFKDGEFRGYVGVLLAAAALMAVPLTLGGTSPASAWHDGLFQAVSTVTTTGFAVGNYGLWPPLAQAVVFALLFVGGSAGSTSGGPKIGRLLIALKDAWNGLQRHLYPRSVAAVRLAGAPVPEGLVGSVTGFLILYAAVWFIGILGLAASGVSFEDAPAASIAALSNVGTAFGATGPVPMYASFSPGAKIVLATLMIIGRLELLSVLALLHPSFWRARRRPG